MVGRTALKLVSHRTHPELVTVHRGLDGFYTEALRLRVLEHSVGQCTTCSRRT